MREHRVGIIMNGVTGRMGTNQHLLRSIVAIIKQGGVKLSDGETIMPDPLLVGRSAAKLRALAARAGVTRVSTDLGAALANRADTVYFDAQITSRRAADVKAAIAAGKHVYCEKPTASSTEAAYELYLIAKRAGVKNGVVQDKLWLPGLRKLKLLVESGFFGELLSVRGEFGYWVFEGETVAPQRPSWNYRKEEGGGIVLDMFAHWRYVLEGIFGHVKSVSCVTATHIGHRRDETGRPYKCTADDAAYATFMLESGVICQFNSSWVVRVRRDDLLTIQVDGTKGTAVAGLRDCFVQAESATPRPVWNPDIESPIDHKDGWTRVPTYQTYDNAFKAQWELFLRHVVKGDPFPWTLLEGARGVQLAELGLRSSAERRWIEVPALEA
jgi:predicted dehydrogenase